MSAPLSELIASYCADTRSLDALPTSTETTFYPDIRTILAAVLKHEKLPFDVRTGTSEKGAASHDMPDFVLGDSGLFVGVYGEVKRADTSLQDLAVSTEQKDQIGRYLAQTGVVLLCNVRGFGLLVCDPTYNRDGITPVPPDNDEAYFAHVPETVWLYQLGGYPVLKKWLGYRQADRQGGRPLSNDDRRWLRQMIHRIAALLALGSTLDALYQQAVLDCFTAAELEIRD